MEENALQEEIHLAWRESIAELNRGRPGISGLLDVAKVRCWSNAEALEASLLTLCRYR